MTLYYSLVRAPWSPFVKHNSASQARHVFGESFSAFSSKETVLTESLIDDQVFLLLVAEMVIFMGLIVPLPYKLKRKLFTFISESPLIAKLQYGMKVCFAGLAFVLARTNRDHVDNLHIHPHPIH
jgi:hypothetical protein